MKKNKKSKLDRSLDELEEVMKTVFDKSELLKASTAKLKLASMNLQITVNRLINQTHTTKTVYDGDDLILLEE